jgi:hypothetical protein
MAAARGGRGFRRFEKLRALAGDTTPLSIASATARSHLGIGGAAEGEGPFDPPTSLREISCCRGSLYPCHGYKMIAHEALKNGRMTVNVGLLNRIFLFLVRVV